MAYRPRTSVEFADSSSVTAFGSARVANRNTVFDSKQIHDGNPLHWDTNTGTGGSVTHQPDESSSRLEVTSSAGSIAIRQTKRRFNYEAGKSQLYLHTCNMNGNVAGIRKRLGYFDANNGIFLELNGTDIRWVIRSSVSGSPSDANFVTQANWNIDKMDGSGGSTNPSNLTIDFTKIHVFIIDFQWLGSSRVRVGFIVRGTIHYVHRFEHTNVLTVVYMQTPNLPIRGEIENLSSGSGNYLDMICCSVATEGGVNTVGITRSINTGLTTPVDVGAIGSRAAIIGVRLKSAYLGATIIVQRISVVIATSGTFLWELQLNPVIAGTYTYSDQTNSAVQTATAETVGDPSSNTITTPGSILESGYSSNEVDLVIADIATPLILGSTIAGVPDEIVLAVGATTINEDFHASMSWRELL